MREKEKLIDINEPDECWVGTRRKNWFFILSKKNFSKLSSPWMLIFSHFATFLLLFLLLLMIILFVISALSTVTMWKEMKRKWKTVKKQQFGRKLKERRKRWREKTFCSFIHLLRQMNFYQVYLEWKEKVKRETLFFVQISTTESKNESYSFSIHLEFRVQISASPFIRHLFIHYHDGDAHDGKRIMMMVQVYWRKKRQRVKILSMQFQPILTS